jgi:hypothetical protein
MKFPKKIWKDPTTNGTEGSCNERDGRTLQQTKRKNPGIFFKKEKGLSEGREKGLKVPALKRKELETNDQRL